MLKKCTVIDYFSNSLIIHQVKTKQIVTLMTVWISDLLQFHFSLYSLVFVSIEKKYQTLETVFHHISKHLEFRQKYSAACHISVFGNVMKHRLNRSSI